MNEFPPDYEGEGNRRALEVPADMHGQGMEIGIPSQRKWVGLIAYILVYLAVGGALVFLFIQFTGSRILATVLVGFMMAYMTAMGWLTMRNADRKE